MCPNPTRKLDPWIQLIQAHALGGNGDGQRRTAGMGDDSPVDETAGERGEYGREAGGYGGRQEYGKRQAGQRQQVVKGK